ncbi:MAG TPA: hypothetical protein PK079_22690 [Leptospiraceae bacterium]|nr:hypothetical protein [Leptospiraceae bacterium]HMW04406.1 hypothetical protein [Leptospiraceae bacterium]HMY34118.1 hypothetical protein [Leptospiraceae bacterium]HMZ63829.1 hypothetical protein [Leptospiraceae bacterium]HNA10220.1 hypothetical protein [Leptospiraceae bacterium]
MNSLKNYIDEALRVTGNRIEEMTPLESKFFREKVLNQFSQKKPFKPLWQKLYEIFLFL